MKPRQTLLLLGALAAAPLVVMPFVVGPAEAAPRPALAAAVSPIGDLGPFRGIATETLKIVGTGDLVAAKARIKDLETRWDDAEATMKPRDPVTWRRLDKAIDAALVALRIPGPQAADCSATLKALIAEMDAVQKPA